MEKQKKTKTSGGINGDKLFVICNTIFMILFVVITLYPVLNTVAISFNDGIDAVRGGIHLIPRKFTLHNYGVVLRMQNMTTGALIAVLRTVIGTLLALVANALLAFIVSRREFIFKSQLSLFWVVTMYVNGGLIPVFLLYRNLGLTYISPDFESTSHILDIAKAYRMPVNLVDPKNPNSPGLNPFAYDDATQTSIAISTALKGLDTNSGNLIDIDHQNTISYQVIENLSILLKEMYPLQNNGDLPNLEDLLNMLNDFYRRINKAEKEHGVRNGESG